MTRVALYARYSSDNQSESSLAIVLKPNALSQYRRSRGGMASLAVCTGRVRPRLQ
jgi:hypothetical protein